MPSDDIIVVDTHALLWWQAGGTRLSARARRAIDTTSHVVVSSITFWEVAMLREKGRIELDRPTTQWTNDLLADPRIDSADLTPHIATAAGTLAGFRGDPADRLIYMTAAALGAPLVTKDRALRGFAKQENHTTTIW